MKTEVLEQVQEEEIRAKPPAELSQLTAPRSKATADETTFGKVRVLASVGEGDLFVESTLIAPISLKTQPFAEGWNLVQGKRVREMEQEINAEGWHFFYVVPDVKGTAMAGRPENAVHNALAKILQSAFNQGLNTVEIASLKVTKLFGIHRAEVVARLRHIQASPYLFVTNEEMRQRMLRTSARTGLIHLRPWHLGHDYREYKPF